MDRNRYLGIETDPLDVALRKESVDRNLSVSGIDDPGRVALRKESVDRNIAMVKGLPIAGSRSPQGERG